jgi:hypothetical protein
MSGKFMLLPLSQIRAAGNSGNALEQLGAIPIATDRKWTVDLHSRDQGMDCSRRERRWRYLGCSACRRFES